MTKKKNQDSWHPPKDLIEAYILNRECRDNPLFKLPEITPDFEKAYAFFDDLFQNRLNENEYSVKEIAEKKGVAYEQILDWAKQNDLFAFGLEMAKQGCYCNAYEALLMNKIEYEKGVRYCVENANEDNEEADCFREELKKIDRENFENSEKVYVMSHEVKPEDGTDKLVLSLTDKEHERVRKWLSKEDVDIRFRFKSITTYNSETKQTVFNIEQEWDEGVTESQKDYIEESTLCAATGSSSTEYARALLIQTMNAVGANDAFSINANFKALLAMKPADEYEGMLISRLIALHQQYMNYMALADANKLRRESRESFINSATKLMRVYNETLEVLNKHRRKGEQKVTVTHNHVNVNEGGKAIVGSEINQKTGVGDNGKK